MRIRWLVPVLLIVAVMVAHPFTATAAPRVFEPKSDLQALDAKLAPVEQALAQGDWAGARTAYAAFDDGWVAVEDGVRTASKTSYRDIESAMGDVKYALKQEPINVAKAQTALRALHTANHTFIGGGTTTTEAPATMQGEMPTLTSALTHVDAALAALTNGDIVGASKATNTFRALWPEVESVVKIKDAKAYRQTEDLMAAAADQLASNQSVQASATLSTLRTTLTPFATDKLTYTTFDAASILLREGLEALLVIAALLAFLQKSGNADKRRWIWGGGIAGIIVSIATAIAVYALFRTFVTGANRELVEGITGLVAAGLLFYVSYWLHSKTSIGGWQKYLKDRTNAALARGSLISLATLAFLSVFREGAETALFYIGIAPSIALGDLLLGLSIGVIILAMVGVLIIGLGVRIPLTQFFRVASLLIWYLGFKFIGSGIHALQVARVVPATTASYLPASETLGLYPTWQTTAAQLALIALAVAIVIALHIVGRHAANTRQPIHA